MNTKNPNALAEHPTPAPRAAANRALAKPGAIQRKQSPEAEGSQPAGTRAAASPSIDRTALQPGKPGAQGVSPPIQAKLTVGAPDDAYEREADRVVGRVMAMPEPAPAQEVSKEEEEKRIQPRPLISPTITPLAQRQEEEERKDKLQRLPPESAPPVLQRQERREEEDKPLQRAALRTQTPKEEEKPAIQRLCEGCKEERQRQPEKDEEPLPGALQRKPAEKEEERLQPKPGGGQPSASPPVEQAIVGQRGGGEPLPEQTRAFFEPRFGMDFSGVRLHTGGEADRLNRSLNARAFTTGQDIFLRQGEHDPESAKGRALLAHELTHVAQQGGEQVRRQSNHGYAATVTTTPNSKESIQRLAEGDFELTEITEFLGQYENALEKSIKDKYLASPDLVALQNRVLQKLIRHVKDQKAPLTPDGFEALAREAGSPNDLTTLLVCHNVAKALSREGQAVSWSKLSNDPLQYAFNGYTVEFDPERFHRDAFPLARGKKSVFYAMFSMTSLGSSDDGDWYAYYAIKLFYAMSLRQTTPQQANVATSGGAITQYLSKIAEQMNDTSIASTDDYRAWRFANAMSFLEGMAFGPQKDQSDVTRESRAHLKGAIAGLAASGKIPGNTWRWYIPKAGSIFTAKTKPGTGVSDVTQNSFKILVGIDGTFRIIILSATVPNQTFDTPDPYVGYKGGFFSSGRTSVKDDTTTPTWNEHITTLNYDDLRSVTLVVWDEDVVSDEEIASFTTDLRPVGLRTQIFTLSGSGCTLKVSVEAEDTIDLK